MKSRNALEKLKNQLSLLNVLGRWVGLAIAERLNKDKYDIGYTSMFIEKDDPEAMVSSGILIVRDLPTGPGTGPDHALAIIATSFAAGDKPVVEIPSRARQYLSPLEHQRFIKAMSSIANEMGIYFTEER